MLEIMAWNHRGEYDWVEVSLVAEGFIGGQTNVYVKTELLEKNRYAESFIYEGYTGFDRQTLEDEKLIREVR